MIHSSEAHLRQVFIRHKLLGRKIKFECSFCFFALFLTTRQINRVADLIISDAKLRAAKLLRVQKGVNQNLSWPKTLANLFDAFILRDFQRLSIVFFVLKRVAEAVQILPDYYCFLCAEFKIHVPEALKCLVQILELEDGVCRVVSEHKSLRLLDQILVAKSSKALDHFVGLRDRSILVKMVINFLFGYLLFKEQANRQVVELFFSLFDAFLGHELLEPCAIVPLIDVIEEIFSYVIYAKPGFADDAPLWIELGYKIRFVLLSSHKVAEVFWFLFELQHHLETYAHYTVERSGVSCIYVAQ